MGEGVSRAQEIEAQYDAADCWLDGSSKGQNEGGKAMDAIFAYAKQMEKVLQANGFRWDGKEWVKP